MKRIGATFSLNFTTQDGDKLPSARKMEIELEKIFAAVLDQYLSEKDIEGNEVHFILCDDFSIENVDEWGDPE